MRQELRLKKQVEAELESDPGVNALGIGVTTDEKGLVVLSGSVGSYTERLTAEQAAKRVAGARAVMNDLSIHPDSSARRTDAEIAACVAEELVWDIAVPRGRVKARVENGWVTLEGSVSFYFQRRAAEAAVRRHYGVKGVSNLITIEAPGRPAELEALYSVCRSDR